MGLRVIGADAGETVTFLSVEQFGNSPQGSVKKKLPLIKTISVALLVKSSFK